MKKQTLAYLAQIDNAIQWLFEKLDDAQQKDCTGLLEELYRNNEGLELVRTIRQTNIASSFILRCDLRRIDPDGKEEYCTLPEGHPCNHLFADGSEEVNER